MGMRSAGGALFLLVAVAASATHHEKFVPLVAFECGYHNRYMSESGSWVSDPLKYATCMKGKFDILKYCRKSYPKMNITNIVEYAHEVTMADWCKDDTKDCTTTHTVRPFRCIVGEFHSEALQVPHGCRFNHENNRDSCHDYSHWKTEAATLCGKKKDDDGKQMTVRSYAMLEPCGIDLFTGVEFVCCPKESDEEKALASRDDEVAEDKLDKHEIAALKEEEEDDEDDYEDDQLAKVMDKSASTAAPGASRDAYFDEPADDLSLEHENYREAIERLEQTHRKKITKVMDEWKELDKKYDSMKEKDAINAELFKREMSNRFEVTVAAFEEDHRKLRKQIEDVHEDRVMSAMNEKKRLATHAYRNALANSVGKNNNKHEVLKTLKAYIRAEEKDRIHALNRYRHLLRTDQKEAAEQKASILHRLKYVDLRVNGTIAMLRDFPKLEKELSDIIYTFWDDFRRENTPELSIKNFDDLQLLKAEDRPARVLDMLEELAKKNHPKTLLHIDVAEAHKTATADKKATVASKSASEPVKLLPADDIDSEEEDDSYYEDENDEELKKPSGKKVPAGAVPLKKDEEEKKEEPVKKIVEPIIKITKVAIDEEKEEKEVETKPVKDAKKLEVEDDAEDDDDEDDSDSDESDEKAISGSELRVDIEPIIDEKKFPRIPRLRQTKFQQTGVWPFTASGYIFAIVAIAAVAFVTFLIIGCRNRRRHIRFVEVDVCSPEERHVSGMQVNGYENPTYSFFDAKA